MPRLNRLADDLWEARDTLRMPGGVVFPLRMTVLRAGGGLVLWSPIRIDDALAAELDALGPVTHLVGPNQFHHLHLPRARERYPEATLLGAPGLAAKRPDIAFDGELAAGAPLLPGLDPVAIEGVPKLNEVVLLHRPSRSLVVTDLVFHILEAQGLMSWFVFRVVAGTLGRCGQSRLLRLVTKDRAAHGASIERLLEEDFDRLVMAHGEVVETGGRAALAKATERVRAPRRRLPAPPIY